MLGLTRHFCVQVGKGKVVKVTGIERAGRTATVLLRGSNKLVLEEAERSLHDALCVVRCLVHKRAMVPGGAAPEVEVGTQLARWSKTLVVRAPTGRQAPVHPGPLGAHIRHGPLRRRPAGQGPHAACALVQDTGGARPSRAPNPVQILLGHSGIAGAQAPLELLRCSSGD